MRSPKEDLKSDGTMPLPSRFRQQDRTALVMQINNTTSDPIWWALFNEGDHVKGLAFKDGIVAPRSDAPWHDDTRARWVVSLRKGSLFGPWIGAWVIDNDTDLTVHKSHRANDAVTFTQRGNTGSAPPEPRTQHLRFRNETQVDLHVVTSWGGIVNQVKNNIASGEQFGFAMPPALGSVSPMEVTVIPGWTVGSEVTAKERDSWNAQTILDTTLDVAGLALALVGGAAAFGAFKIGVAVSRGLAFASGVQAVASVVAPGGVLPTGLDIKNVGGPDTQPLMVCRGGKSFGTMRGGELHLEAVSPVVATIWEVKNGVRSQRCEPPDASTWDFVPFMDSDGNDAGNAAGMTLEQMKYFADKTPGVVAFNSGGWMKTVLRPESEWVEWTTDSSKGMWVLNR